MEPGIKQKGIIDRLNLKDDSIRLIIYFLSFLWVIKLGVIIESDSKGYIDMLPIRSVGYPLFIKITTFFGLIHTHILTVLAAWVLGVVAIHRFTDFLKIHLKLSGLSTVAVTIILITPYFLSSVANAITTESIAYPLFLFSICLFFKSAFDKSVRAAIGYFIVASLLIMVRSQFVYMHLLSFFLIIYLFITSKQKKNSFLVVLGVYIISILGSSITDRAYHYIVHHRFVTTPFTGIQLITPALYNVTAADTALFSAPVERGLIDTVVKCLKTNEIYNLKLNNTYSEDIVYKYSHVYTQIEGRYSGAYIVNSLLRKGYKEHDIDLWIAADNVTTAMAIKLFRAHPDKYLKLFLANFNYSFGSRTFLIGFFTLFLFGLILFFKTRSNAAIIFITACLTKIFTVGIVSLIEEPMPRYYLYHDYLMFVVITIAVMKFIEEGFTLKTKPD